MYFNITPVSITNILVTGRYLAADRYLVTQTYLVTDRYLSQVDT